MAVAVYTTKDNAWREYVNPLRGLTLEGLVAKIEQGERGAFADVQWFYQAMERSDALIATVVMRRRAALLSCGWDVKTEEVPQDQVLAQEQAGGRETCIHMNLSGSAFSDPDLLDYLCGEIADTGVDPSKLTIEITETSVITDIAFARTFIESLQATGCRFALDDFGAGASSLYYLKHLPVNCLKIDGSLIVGLDADSRDVHFVRAIVEMCKGLGVTTIAEHLGDQDVYCMLAEFGVDCGQGYLLGRPRPLSDYLLAPPAGPGAASCDGSALDASST